MPAISAESHFRGSDRAIRPLPMKNGAFDDELIDQKWEQRALRRTEQRDDGNEYNGGEEIFGRLEFVRLKGIFCCCFEFFN